MLRKTILRLQKIVYKYLYYKFSKSPCQLFLLFPNIIQSFTTDDNNERHFFVVITMKDISLWW